MSIDRIEKLLSANERFLDLNRDALRDEIRKLQDENDRLKKLVYYNHQGEDNTNDEGDPSPVTYEVIPDKDVRLKKRKGWYTSGHWIKHDSDTIPDDLAPAQFVEVLTVGSPCRTRADGVLWRPGKTYQDTHDNKGVPYCADVDLEPWAEYVATDMDGIVNQYAATPKWCADDRMWDNTRGGWKKIPEYSARVYRKNVPASESLMRVWRDV